MFKIYFEINNGKIVDPRRILPPAYYAILDWKLKVIEIKCCFGKDNIERHGDEWMDDELLEEKWYWDNYHWLMKSLKQYIRHNIIDLWFNRLPDEEQTHEAMDRFIYYTCWKFDDKNKSDYEFRGWKKLKHIVDEECE